MVKSTVLHIPRKGKAPHGAPLKRVIIDRSTEEDDDLEGTVRTDPESDNSSAGSNTSSLASHNSQQLVEQQKAETMKNRTISSKSNPGKLGSVVNRFGPRTEAAAATNVQTEPIPKSSLKKGNENKKKAAAAAAPPPPNAARRASAKNDPGGCDESVCTAAQDKPELQGILRDYYYNENNVLVHKNPPKIKIPPADRIKPTRSKSGISSTFGVKLRKGKRPEKLSFTNRCGVPKLGEQPVDGAEVDGNGQQVRRDSITGEAVGFDIGGDVDLGCDSDDTNGSYEPVGTASPRSVMDSGSGHGGGKKATFSKPRLQHKDSFTGENAFAAASDSGSGSDSDGFGAIPRTSQRAQKVQAMRDRRLQHKDSFTGECAFAAANSDSGSDSDEFGGLANSGHRSTASIPKTSHRAQKLQAMRDRRPSASSCGSVSDSSDSECPYQNSYGCGNAILTIDSPSGSKLNLGAAGFGTTPDLDSDNEDDGDNKGDTDTSDINDSEDEFATTTGCCAASRSSRGSKGSNKARNRRSRSNSFDRTPASGAAAPSSIPRDSKKKHNSLSSSLSSPRKMLSDLDSDSSDDDCCGVGDHKTNSSQMTALVSPHRKAAAGVDNKQDGVWKFDLSALEQSAESAERTTNCIADDIKAEMEECHLERKKSKLQRNKMISAAKLAAAQHERSMADKAQHAEAIDQRKAERAARLKKAKERIEREQVEKQREEEAAKAEKKRLLEEELKKGGVKSKEDRQALAYQWYTRCGMPSRSNLKRRISQIKSCDITADDVDLLPWMAGGSMVNVGSMMKLTKTDAGGGNSKEAKEENIQQLHSKLLPSSPRGKG